MAKRFLTLEDRYMIQELLLQNKNNTEIGQILGFDRSTISKELSRNGGKALYDPKRAQDLFENNKTSRRDRLSKKFNPELQNFTHLMLKNYLSPEQIVMLAKQKGFKYFPCLQTIYNYIARGIFLESQQDKEKYLRCKGKKTTKKQRDKLATRFKHDGRSIYERPQEINEREEFGHLECDTIVSGYNTHGLGVLLVIRERLTRFTWVIKLPNKQASTIRDALIKELKPYKKHIKTITTDQGREFALFEQVEQALGCDFYFCEPGKPYQKGSVENVNRLIRQFIPKGSNIDNYSARFVSLVAKSINRRPMLCLNGIDSENCFLQYTKKQNVN